MLIKEIKIFQLKFKKDLAQKVYIFSKLEILNFLISYPEITISNFISSKDTFFV